MHKLLITAQNYKKESYLTALIDEKGRIIETDLYPIQEHQAGDKSAAQSLPSSVTIGTICIGKVKSIVKNLNAAFVDVAKGVTCYLSIDNIENAWFSHQAREGLLTEGDEVVVQVIKEGIKTKFPTAGTKFSLTGKYFVLTNEHKRLGLSGKLSAEDKARLEPVIWGRMRSDYGLIVRTNAGAVAEDTLDTELFAELSKLEAQYDAIRAIYPHRTCYSVLNPAKPFYQTALDNVYQEDLEEIITDDKTIYNSILELYAKDEALLAKLRLYQDDALTLTQVYNVNTQLEKALQERVWLKSGAYLVIQPTEALTVIDVNSGKNTSKKKMQEYYYKINAEAAAEIARQLRLRNISGIVVIDFINMEKNSDRQELMNVLRSHLKCDPIPTQLVDITRLGLVEVTRKKGRKPLAEQVERFR